MCLQHVETTFTLVMSTRNDYFKEQQEAASVALAVAVAVAVAVRKTLSAGQKLRTGNAIG